MSLLDYFFKKEKEDTGSILDEAAPQKTAQSSKLARDNAKKFLMGLDEALETIRNLDGLLESPEIKRDPEKHLLATTTENFISKEAGQISILFSLETGEPIYAYFKNKKANNPQTK